MKETMFKQTEVGMIPSDWEVVSLGNLVEMSSGTTPSRFNEKNFQGNVCWLSSGELKSHYIFNTKEKISTSAASSMRIYPKGTVVIAMYGLEAEGVRGTASILATESTISQACMAFSNLKRINNEFFYYWYAANGDVIGSKYAQGTKQQNLSPEVMKNVLVSFPPIEEQKRIAQALSDVDAVINTTEKLIAKKKALKQGAMQTLLSGKMRIQNGKWIKTTHFKQTELGPIPQEWEVRRLSNLGVFSKGCGISRDESNTGVIPAVRYGELYTTHNDYIKSFTSHISKDVASKARLLKKGDLLFTCSGETKEDIGKCVAFIGDEVAYAGGDLMILTPSININSLFYGFLLNTSIVVKQKSSRAQGDAVVHISSDSIGKILVPFPPQAEQTAIATVLSDMDSEIAAQETKLAKYRQLKTGMMQQLLTGKVRLV